MRAPAFFLFCMSLIAASESMANECGDINSDGIVNVLDVVLLVNMVLSDGYTASADLNNDDVVNVLDVVVLVNMILAS